MFKSLNQTSPTPPRTVSSARIRSTLSHIWRTLLTRIPHCVEFLGFLSLSLFVVVSWLRVGEASCFPVALLKVVALASPLF